MLCRVPRRTRVSGIVRTLPKSRHAIAALRRQCVWKLCAANGSMSAELGAAE